MHIYISLLVFWLGVSEQDSLNCFTIAALPLIHFPVTANDFDWPNKFIATRSYTRENDCMQFFLLRR